MVADNSYILAPSEIMQDIAKIAEGISEEKKKDEPDIDLIKEKTYQQFVKGLYLSQGYGDFYRNNIPY